MGEKDRQFAPLRKFTFSAGECGGEIRVNIPTTASKADVILMARDAHGCGRTVGRTGRFS